MWNVLPDLILKPARFKISDHASEFRIGTTPESYSLTKEDLQIVTSDGVKIAGWFIHSSEEQAKGTVILIHGIGGFKESLLHRAKVFSTYGYHTVLFDLRAHGMSGGDFCTYGFHEKDDINQIVDSITKKTNGLAIGICGSSLGGAIAYQCLSNDSRLKFGIIESTFDDLRNVVREYTSRFIGFRFDLVSDFGLWRAGVEGGFNPDEISPMTSAQVIEVPMFVAHGNKDMHIPIQYGRRNFDALKSTNKTFYEVAGAGHNDLGLIGGVDYEQALKKFLNELTFIKMEKP